MTFDELEDKLPNGFHDCKIRKINVDFVGGPIRLDMNLLVGLPDTANPDEYRAGTLEVISPNLFFIEPPYRDPRYPFRLFDGSALSAAGFSLTLGEDAKLDPLLHLLPVEALAYGFFLHDWNTCLYLGGASIEFFWDDGEPVD